MGTSQTRTIAMVLQHCFAIQKRKPSFLLAELFLSDPLPVSALSDACGVRPTQLGFLLPLLDRALGCRVADRQGENLVLTRSARALCAEAVELFRRGIACDLRERLGEETEVSALDRDWVLGRALSRDLRGALLAA